MTTPTVVELPRTLEPTTADAFIGRPPFCLVLVEPCLVLVEPGGTPMTHALTAPTTGAADAADR